MIDAKETTEHGTVPTDQKGRWKCPYIPILDTQCSIYSSILKKIILPHSVTNRSLHCYFSDSFQKVFQRIVYTLHFLTSQLLCNSKSSSFCSYLFPETAIAKVTTDFHVIKFSGNESEL